MSHIVVEMFTFRLITETEYISKQIKRVVLMTQAGNRSSNRSGRIYSNVVTEQIRLKPLLKSHLI